MIDFQSLSASLASVSIIPPRERTKGLNGRSEGGCRRRFSLATVLRCFQTSSVVLSVAESSPLSRALFDEHESWVGLTTGVESSKSQMEIVDHGDELEPIQ
jgi:hypothetical protein